MTDLRDRGDKRRFAAPFAESRETRGFGFGPQSRSNHVDIGGGMGIGIGGGAGGAGGGGGGGLGSSRICLSPAGLFQAVCCKMTLRTSWSSTLIGSSKSPSRRH